MATDKSINIRREAAMRSIENSLSHFGDFGVLPRQHRYPKILHVLQLERVAEILDGMAQQIFEDAMQKAQEEEDYE
jgi:hypothetical protein